MKVAPIYEVKNGLSRFIAETDNGPVIITKNGKPRAALVTLEGADIEAFILGHSPRFLALLDRTAQQAQAHGIPFSEIEAEVQAKHRKPRKVNRRKRDV